MEKEIKLNRIPVYKMKDADGVVRIKYQNIYLQRKSRHQTKFKEVLECLKKE